MSLVSASPTVQRAAGVLFTVGPGRMPAAVTAVFSPTLPAQDECFLFFRPTLEAIWDLGFQSGSNPHPALEA